MNLDSQEIFVLFSTGQTTNLSEPNRFNYCIGYTHFRCWLALSEIDFWKSVYRASM